MVLQAAAAAVVEETHGYTGKMITKKTIREGKPLTQVFTSPLAFLHDFFQTKPVEPKAIIFGTREYRTYVKKQVVEERKTEWGAIHPIKEKIRRR